MTERLHCDQCGVTTKPVTARGWFVVDSLLDAYPGMHFCSWGCLAEYAKQEESVEG
jgi:hypothetical protein